MRAALKDPRKLRGTTPQVPPETSMFRYQWLQRRALKLSPESQELVETWGVEVSSKPQSDAQATLVLTDLPLAHWSGAFPNTRLPLPGENTALSIFLLQKALTLFFVNARLFLFNQAHIKELYQVPAVLIPPPNVSFNVTCLWPCTFLLFRCPNLIRAERTHKKGPDGASRSWQRQPERPWRFVPCTCKRNQQVHAPLSIQFVPLSRQPDSPDQVSLPLH